MSSLPSMSTVDELVERYDAFGFDSFGVLVDGKDPLPGAQELVSRLNTLGKPFVVATNDASKLTESRVELMRGQGFDVELENVVTSGSLLEGWAESNALAGSKVLSTGGGEAREYVVRAGMEPVGLGADAADASGLIIAGIQGYDWETALSRMVTVLYLQLDAGRAFPGAVPNPDVLYPDGVGKYAIGPGGLAALIEVALERGFGPVQRWRFDKLGKPHAPMFDEIKRRLPVGSDVVFFGDQLHTDIQGANLAGFASVLTGTGIARWRSRYDFSGVDAELTPTYLIESLSARSVS